MAGHLKILDLASIVRHALLKFSDELAPAEDSVTCLAINVIPVKDGMNGTVITNPSTRHKMPILEVGS